MHFPFIISNLLKSCGTYSGLWASSITWELRNTKSPVPSRPSESEVMGWGLGVRIFTSLPDNQCMLKFTLFQWLSKNLPVMQETQKTRVQSLGWKDPLEKEMISTPVFLPGKSHGQRSLAGYSLWGRKDLDTTEHAGMHAQILEPLLQRTLGQSIGITSILSLCCFTTCYFISTASSARFLWPRANFGLLGNGQSLPLLVLTCAASHCCWILQYASFLLSELELSEAWSP